MILRDLIQAGREFESHILHKIMKQNIYTHRWENALRIANTINKKLLEGYLILNGSGEQVNELIITDNKIMEYVSKSVRVTYFENDLDYDHGLYTPIIEYNDRFKDWKCIHPKNIERLV